MTKLVTVVAAEVAGLFTVMPTVELCEGSGLAAQAAEDIETNTVLIASERRAWPRLLSEANISLEGEGGVRKTGGNSLPRWGRGRATI
ncbi:hypothetical protein llg_12990 [Luteolibacter sp. LG18]|nr:hypothetical protein llg_12990 [Luteolibacter sp. LG18]